MEVLIRDLYRNFSAKYPYLLQEDRVDYFSFFAGLEDFDLNLFDSKELVIKDIVNRDDIVSIFPFYIFDDPFRKLLIKLSKSDGKMNSLFNRVGVGESLGLELVEELINSNILTLLKTREPSLRYYPKQKIKKEYKYYTIEDKLYFTKPFYRFWFSFVESNRYSDLSYENTIKSFNKWGYKLTSQVFELLSIELLRDYYKNSTSLVELGSYWDRVNEFDLYCKTQDNRYILGECKYKNRHITYAEFNKLESKARQSGLKVDYFALFSKSGFSQEFYRDKKENLLLFDLNDFDRLIEPSQ